MGLRPPVKDEGEHAVDPRINNSARNRNQGSSSSSSSLSSSSSASVSSPIQREAWTARGQLLMDFHHVISRAINSPGMIHKCSEIAQDMKRSEASASAGASPSVAAIEAPAGRHTMAEEYSAEAALIVENKSNRDAVVMSKAMTLGLLSFVALRSGRGLSSLMRKSIANSRSGGEYQFDKIAASKELNTISSNEPRSKRRQLFSWALDVSISTSIVILSGTFLFMPRPSAYIEDMSKLPLVEGKSVYAEMVCPPLLQEYRRVLMQYGGRWPVNRGAGTDYQLTQEDVSLNVIRTFVKNCYKRSIYERALLEERNALRYDTDSTVSRLMKRIERRMGGNESMNGTLGRVSVPSPGVPEDISVNIDSEILSLPPRDGKKSSETPCIT